MRLLIVEDDLNLAEALTDGLEEFLAIGEITLCRSRDAALYAIDHQFYDYAILDLKIPTVDDQLDAETDHGEAVYRQLRDTSPGTPVCIFSAYFTEDFLTDHAQENENVDVWGSGRPFSMVKMLSKRRLNEISPFISEIEREIQSTDEIEIIADPHPGFLEKRVLRIFGRRYQAASLVVDKLSGGLSGVQVRRTIVRDRNGNVQLTAAAKIGSRSEIRKEIANYKRDVVRLPNGRYSVYVGEVFAGAGSTAGVFYRLIEGFRPLTALLQQDQNRAASVVRNLENALSVWSRDRPHSSCIVQEIRRRLVSDEDMFLIRGQLTGIDWESFEQRRIQAKLCCQHGDLHCENVLVEHNDEPIIIDFGRVGETVASVDPVTLELSLIFHPGCRLRSERWPTVAHLEHWDDINSFTENCPAALFIRATREWALASAAGQREIYATAYAFCVRQLKYPDTDVESATTIIRSVITASQLT
jgi:CheY-like chemotaxis protein